MRRNTAMAVMLILFCAPLWASDSLHVSNPRASFLDVAQRRHELTNTSNPRLLAAIHQTKSCLTHAPVDPPEGKIFIPRRYVSGGHGKVDPRESELSQPYYQIQDLAADGADKFLLTGDTRESKCVLDALDSWARAHTLHDYDLQKDTQAWNQVTWTVASLALSVSIIEQDTNLDRVELDRVIAWLHHATEKLAGGEKEYGELRANENNLSYWRGLAATATGVISSDDKMFSWGVAQYERAIGQLSKDGSWPLEMEREELAVHYQSFALQPLVMIAELAQRQGYNLYAFTAHGHTLKDAVVFLTSAIEDPSIATKRAGAEQKIDLADNDFFSWLEFWNAHFGAGKLSKYLDHPWFAARLAGSATLFAAPIAEGSHTSR